MEFGHINILRTTCQNELHFQHLYVIRTKFIRTRSSQGSEEHGYTSPTNMKDHPLNQLLHNDSQHINFKWSCISPKLARDNPFLLLCYPFSWTCLLPCKQWDGLLLALTNRRRGARTAIPSSHTRRRGEARMQITRVGGLVKKSPFRAVALLTERAHAGIHGS